MGKYEKYFALFFGICASFAVLIFAMARHKITNLGQGEIYNIIAQQMLFHSFLGIMICVLSNKFGRFYFVPIIFCIFGILLFCLPVFLRANGIIEASPTAPFGGLSFSLAWLSTGISIFIGQKQNDKT